MQVSNQSLPPAAQARGDVPLPPVNKAEKAQAVAPAAEKAPVILEKNGVLPKPLVVSTEPASSVAVIAQQVETPETDVMTTTEETVVVDASEPSVEDALPRNVAARARQAILDNPELASQPFGQIVSYIARDLPLPISNAPSSDGDGEDVVAGDDAPAAPSEDTSAEDVVVSGSEETAPVLEDGTETAEDTTPIVDVSTDPLAEIIDELLA